MSKKLLILISLIVIVALAIPLTIYLVRQQQNQKSQAQASTTLSFSPTTQTVDINDRFTLTVKIDPGSNLVSFVNLQILYDKTKFNVTEADIEDINTGKLSRLQGPFITEEGIRINYTAGNDPTRVITQPTDLMKVTFTAIAGTGGSPSPITFGDKTTISSTGSGDSAAENVLASSTPAQITVSDGAVPTASPTTDPNPTSEPPSPTPDNTVVNTPTPTRTPTPTATQQAVNATATPSPTSTLLAQGPTSTPTPIGGSVNSNSASTTGTPTPTIAATGPGTIYLGLGALVAIFMLVGSLLFFTL